MLRVFFVPHFPVLVEVCFVEHNDVVFASIDEIFVNIWHLAECPNIRYFMSLGAWVKLVFDIPAEVD